jgi:hypothetical protein
MVLNIIMNPSRDLYIINAASETQSKSFFYENKECQKFRQGLKFVKYWLGCTRNSHPYNKEMKEKLFPKLILQREC